VSFDDDFSHDVQISTNTHSDAELITAVRAGAEDAFAQLWRRHEAAALRLARQITNPSNAEDLVSESFVRVLRALRGGGGPDGAFRPYLFSTLRRLNIDNARSYTQRVTPTADNTDLEREPAASAAEVAAVNAENSAAWRAWASLPESTRTLLWHLVIEGDTPAQIAPLVGTTANGVSSRAVRARERLRQAFLQQHVGDSIDDACRQTRSRLGEYVRGALSVRDRAAVQSHLDQCDSCPEVLFELADVNQTLRVIIAPIVLGGVGLAAYLSPSAAHSAGAAVGMAAGGHAASHAVTPAVGAHVGSGRAILRLLHGHGRTAATTGALAAVAVAATAVIAAAATLQNTGEPISVAPPVAVSVARTIAPRTSATQSTPAEPPAASEPPTASEPPAASVRPTATVPPTASTATPRPAAARSTAPPRASSTGRLARSSAQPQPAPPGSVPAPSATPTPVPSSVPTPTSTATPTGSPSPTASPTDSPTPPAQLAITGQPHFINFGSHVDAAAPGIIEITVPDTWQLTAITIGDAGPSGFACQLVTGNTARCDIAQPVQPNTTYRYTIDLLGPADDHTSQSSIRYANGTAYDQTITPTINPAS